MEESWNILSLSANTMPISRPYQQVSDQHANIPPHHQRHHSGHFNNERLPGGTAQSGRCNTSMSKTVFNFGRHGQEKENAGFLMNKGVGSDYLKQNLHRNSPFQHHPNYSDNNKESRKTSTHNLQKGFKQIRTVFQRSLKPCNSFLNSTNPVNEHLVPTAKQADYNRSNAVEIHVQETILKPKVEKYQKISGRTLSKSESVWEPNQYRALTYFPDGRQRAQRASNNQDHPSSLLHPKSGREQMATSFHMLQDESQRNKILQCPSRLKKQQEVSVSVGRKDKPSLRKDQHCQRLKTEHAADLALVHREEPKAVQTRQIKLSDFIVSACKGEGRFGKVFLAVHKKTGFLCALKRIKKQSVSKLMDQLILQIKIQQFLNHPNLVKIYGYFTDHEHFYMLIECMEEGSLYSLIKKNTTFNESVTASKMLEVCRAIEFMHRHNIIHRDLKPENVVLTHGVCKLCDFGWAAVCEDRRMTYCGTLDYVCPEIIEGKSYDKGVDIWCLGIMAFEMMTGKAPFYDLSRQKTLSKIKNCKLENLSVSLSKKAMNFIGLILQKDPEQRVDIQQLLNSQFLLSAPRQHL